MSSAKVAVIGGGWAGLSAATLLAEAGFDVTLFERSRVLGGRSTSFWERDFGEWLDHGPHLFIGAYREALRLLEIWGSIDNVQFGEWNSVTWLMEDGKRHSLEIAKSLPESLYSFSRFKYLSLNEKLNLIKAMKAFKEGSGITLFANSTIKDVLRSLNVTTDNLLEFFETLSLAVMNAPIETTAAAPFSAAIREWFVSDRRLRMIGIPKLPLKEIVGDAAEHWLLKSNVKLKKGINVTGVEREDGTWNLKWENEREMFESVIIASSPKDLARLLATKELLDLFDAEAFDYSPIAGIHCTFDKPVIDVPFAHLHNSQYHWIFGRGREETGGWRRVSFVISNAADEEGMSKGEQIASLTNDLRNRLPEVKSASILNFRYVKTVRATIMLTPEVEQLRLDHETNYPGLYVAGDWIDTGLPATIESAARSGRSAAEALISNLK